MLTDADLMDEINGVADAHLKQHGVTFHVNAPDGMVGNTFFITFERPDWSTKEVVCLGKMPEATQAEYVHCAMHAVAATLLEHLFG